MVRRLFVVVLLVTLCTDAARGGGKPSARCGVSCPVQADWPSLCCKNAKGRKESADTPDEHCACYIAGRSEIDLPEGCEVRYDGKLCGENVVTDRYRVKDLSRRRALQGTVFGCF